MGNYPIFTADTECQDCYKCVRFCPVKAIRVNDGRAKVIAEQCTGCGRCVEVCPAHAKKVRNDLEQLRQLFKGDEPIYVSLAPSYVSEFNSATPAQIINACRKLGFSEVSETALGAQLVSREVATLLEQDFSGLMISSACPAMVDFIRLYLPGFAPAITQVLSPALAHCALLRTIYGDKIKIVFIGPCIAKKNEADRRGDLMNLALSFTEFKQLLRENKISLDEVEATADDVFVPHNSHEGALYPIEGGMIETIKALKPDLKVHYATVCGLENLRKTLEKLSPETIKEPVFLEVLACQGGCVHGPCTELDNSGLIERLRIQSQVDLHNLSTPEEAKPIIQGTFTAQPTGEGITEPSQITSALRLVGKTTREDELNCGGCGYDSCRKFATALAAGKAESSMCVSYMRKLAQNKANGLLRSMPSGVIIADKKLNIIECNYNFAAAFGTETLEAFEACPGLSGADLRRIVPFAQWFDVALSTGEDFKRENYRIGKKLFNITIFTVELHEVVGAVVTDVTMTELRREQIATRARKVIDNNLAIVQDIACRLGEQMADTELILRSIADDYADEPNGADGGGA